VYELCKRGCHTAARIAVKIRPVFYFS
jgi:hypothetical protein